MNVECKLTEHDILKLSKKLSAKQIELCEKETRKSNFASEIGAEIKTIRARIDHLSGLVNSGKEFREVPCIVKYDFKKGTKAFFRKDNGRLVEIKDIEPHETQADFF